MARRRNRRPPRRVQPKPEGEAPDEFVPDYDAEPMRLEDRVDLRGLFGAPHFMHLPEAVRDDAAVGWVADNHPWAVFGADEARARYEARLNPGPRRREHARVVAAWREAVRAREAREAQGRHPV